MKRPTFIERVGEARKVHAGPCVKARVTQPFRACSVLAACLASNEENPKAGGLEVAPSMDRLTGKWSDTIVYIPPKTKGYAVVTHCPFCGQAVR